MICHDIKKLTYFSNAHDSTITTNKISTKKSSVYVVYTRWKNLKKTSDMVDGQVGFHRPQNVRRVQVEKNNSIVNKLNKSKREEHPDLYAQQQKRLSQIQQEKKAHKKKLEKQKRVEEEEKKRRKEELSYDRVFTDDNMTSNSGKFKTCCSFSFIHFYKGTIELSLCIQNVLSIRDFYILI